MEMSQFPIFNMLIRTVKSSTSEKLIKYRKIISLPTKLSLAICYRVVGEVTLMEMVPVSEIKRDYDWSLI